MGSFNPPDDAFDDADLENLEQASQAILTTLVAHSPAGGVAALDALKLQVRAAVYALACVNGETNPQILRSRILEALPLNSFVLSEGRGQRAH